jgi:hypothetical protein
MFPPVEGRSDLAAAKSGDFSHCGLKSGSGQLLMRENVISPDSRVRKIVSKNIDNFGRKGLDCPPLPRTDIYPIGRPGCAVSVDGGHRPPYMGNTKIFSIMKLPLRTKFPLIPPFPEGGGWRNSIESPPLKKGDLKIGIRRHFWQTILLAMPP